MIVPSDASIAVMQGAVMFGKKHNKITERVLTKTYGADCCRDFIKGVHPKKTSSSLMEKRCAVMSSTAS